MRPFNRNKKRVLRELLNERRPKPFSDEYAIKGFNKIFKTPTVRTYEILDDLVAVGIISNPDIDKVKQAYYVNRGKSVNITYLINHTDVIHKDRPLDFNVTIPDNTDGNEFQDYWSGEVWRYMIESDVSVFDDNENQGVVYIRPQTSLATTKNIKQSFLDGVTHCVFTPIKKWLEKNIEKTESKENMKLYTRKLKKLGTLILKYKNGVPEEDMESVCKALNTKITISYPFCDTENIYGKALLKPKVFNFINTRLNHLEEGVMVIDKKYETVTRDYLYSMVYDLDARNEYYYTTKDHKGIKSVNTLTEAFMCNTEFDEALNEFEKKNGLTGMKICDIKQPELALFIQRGVHYNTSFALNETTPNLKSKMIDQKKAYYNFKKCKFYEGFLGKITDFRKCNKIMGVGLYLVDKFCFNNCLLKNRKKFVELNGKLGCFQNNNVYTSAELNYLSHYGITYKIVAGCWGIETLDFEFGEEFLQKTEKTPFVNEYGEFSWKGISFYAKTAGVWDSHSTHYYRYVKGTEEYAQILKQNSPNLIVKYKDSDEICIGVKKKSIATLSHISSFILAYQRISLLEQLMEMEMDKIQAIYVDGIYYEDHEFKVLDTFENKEIDSEMVFRRDSFITNMFKTKPNIKYAEKRETFKTELFLGAGGNGKTHFNLTDKGFINLLYSAPSHKLNANKKHEYNVSVEVWAALLADNPQTYERVCKYYNVIVFDEVSMMANTEKELLMKKYPTHKLIFCGDVGYQLPVISTWEEPKPEFEITGFENTQEFKTNHRCKDVRLLSILNELRDLIKEGYKTVPWNFIEKFKRIDDEMVKATYKIEDMIICGTNRAKDYYTDMFKDLKKWYVNKTTEYHNNGDIIISEEQPKNSVIRHAFTAHSIQGETAQFMLFINSKKLQDIRGFYTAVSRAKTYEQILVI